MLIFFFCVTALLFLIIVGLLFWTLKNEVESNNFKQFKTIDFETYGELIKDFGLGMMVNGMYGIGQGILTIANYSVIIVSLLLIGTGLKIKRKGAK